MLIQPFRYPKLFASYANSPAWCNVVIPGGQTMKTSKRQETVPRAAIADTVRASITFPHELYERLEELARNKKVSLAWIVRDAAEMYVTKQAKVLQGAKASPLA